MDQTQHIIKCPALGPLHQEQLRQHWNREYPSNLAYEPEAFSEYLEKLGDTQHYLILDKAGSLQAWLATFNRDGQRWFAMIISGQWQGKGYGRLLLDEAKKEGVPLLGWAVDHGDYVRTDGVPYPSPVGFYLRNGFETLPDRLEIDKLSAVKIKWLPVPLAEQKNTRETDA